MTFSFEGNLACLFISSSYVISLYFIPSNIRKLPRDDPKHIRRRMIAAASSTLISFLICHYNFKYWNFPSDITFLQACGLRLDTFSKVFFITFFLMMIFYIGPLISNFMYSYISYQYGVNDNGRLIEEKGRKSKENIFVYFWEIISR